MVAKRFSDLAAPILADPARRERVQQYRDELASCITHCLHDMGDGIWMRCCWCPERRARPRPQSEADAYHNRSHAVPGPFWTEIEESRRRNELLPESEAASTAPMESKAETTREKEETGD